jgi:hypothetical protein
LHHMNRRCPRNPECKLHPIQLIRYVVFGPLRQTFFHELN